MFDDRMDPEVVDLCIALNQLPGVITTESCSGHGEQPLQIWFKVDGRIDPKLRGLFFLTRCTDRRYWQHGYEWKISLSVSDTIIDGILPTMFLLESEAKGEDAYSQAKDLIKNMDHHLNHDNFKKYFDIDLREFGSIDEQEMSVRTGEERYSFITPEGNPWE